MGLTTKELNCAECSKVVSDYCSDLLDFRSIQLEQLKESLTHTKASVDEQKDKEERMNSIIMYRVEES